MHVPSFVSKIRALGWDLDGTLYPTQARLTSLIHQKQREAVAEKMGWDLPRTQKEYAKRYRRLGSNTKTMTSFGVDGVKFFTGVWDEIDISKFIHRDGRIIRLFSLLKGLRHFLISNSNRIDQVRKKLDFIGLRPKMFELIVSTVELGAVKPDPQPFLFALEKLELEPQEVMFIGDRVTTDILGARGVGMRTCLVGKESKDADISLPTVYDVGELFKVQNAKRKTQSHISKGKARGESNG